MAATLIMVNPTRSRELAFREGREALSAETGLKPIQMQDRIAGVPQPSGNFSWLKRSISGTEVPIQQLGYRLSGAWFLDLVQCSAYGLVEATIRI